MCNDERRTTAFIHVTLPWAHQELSALPQAWEWTMGWLGNKVLGWSTNVQKRELEEFVGRLRALDGSKVGMFVACATNHRNMVAHTVTRIETETTTPGIQWQRFKRLSSRPASSSSPRTAVALG